MTWQRIDENTYIDDTLVTCTEYQLFIDEMREQGKYYQPDHWTTYQFPLGQAREPILGVRHSDAVSFCKWLTNRESVEWKFRLSTQEEADPFVINSFGRGPLGYWNNGNYLFTWIGSIPTDARDLAFENDGTLDQLRMLDMSRAIIFARSRALDFSQTHSLELARAPIPVREGDKVVVKSTKIDMAHIVDRRKLGFDTSLESILTRNHANNRDIIIARNFEIYLTLDGSLDLCIDLLTLRERIAGRSPAFEGIRLVKERIR